MTVLPGDIVVHGDQARVVVEVAGDDDDLVGLAAAAEFEVIGHVDRQPVWIQDSPDIWSVT